MAKIPYLLELHVTLGANATGTLQHTVPRNESMQVMEFVFSSTGTFEITTLETSGGNSNANVSSNLAIPSVNLKNADDERNGIGRFEIPLEIAGGSTLLIDVKDLSGAGNTIKITMSGVRDV